MRQAPAVQTAVCSATRMLYDCGGPFWVMKVVNADRVSETVNGRRSTSRIAFGTADDAFDRRAYDEAHHWRRLLLGRRLLLAVAERDTRSAGHSTPLFLALPTPQRHMSAISALGHRYTGKR